MGCGASSQSVSVIEVESVKNTSSHKVFDTKTASNVDKPSIKLIPLPTKKNPSAGTYDSGINSHLDSDDASIYERRSSISSESDSDDVVLRKIITENSKRDVVNKIESEFIDRSYLDLEVKGKSCPPLLTDKEKQLIKIKEENETVKMLKTNGLVPKPVVLNQNFALFEIVEDKNKSNQQETLVNIHKPPPRLTEKIKPVLTAEEIQDKLQKANQRKIVRKFFFVFILKWRK